jgi:hypothetical protein
MMEIARDTIFLAIITVLAIRLAIEVMMGITITIARRSLAAPRTRVDTADADSSLTDGRWG